MRGGGLNTAAIVMLGHEGVSNPISPLGPLYRGGYHMAAAAFIENKWQAPRRKHNRCTIVVSGSFPPLLLDLCIVFTKFKTPSSSCSRGESQKPLPH